MHSRKAVYAGHRSTPSHPLYDTTLWESTQVPLKQLANKPVLPAQKWEA